MGRGRHEHGRYALHVPHWEYTTSVVTHGFMGRQADELNRQELETSLNELGGKGWELAVAFLDANLHREKDGHVLVFKRWIG